MPRPGAVKVTNDASSTTAVKTPASRRVRSLHARDSAASSGSASNRRATANIPTLRW
ncbi:MAG: hypothetical protein JO197_22920 [Acidobacteria bacterium]|nr:hypothetical protein [Acidobacteriota bacterium]MBV9477941.1 hypothetical protein [Acidobacteriota bacterium]